jgi:hypothetical protein
MITLDSLKDFHKDKPAAVLGAGPSLIKDIKKLPPDCILISVNGHTLKMFPQAHYLAFIDDPARMPHFVEMVKDYHGIRVCHHLEWSDVDFEMTPWWNLCRFSGEFATWLACWMGCIPVLLCGMDCYQGNEKYFYEWDVDPRDKAFTRPLDYHLDEWRKAFTNCRNPENIKAVSGPLVSLFGEYSPNA